MAVSIKATKINYHPVFSFEDDLMVMEGGRVVIGFEVRSVEMERLGNLEYEALNTAFEASLKNLKVGTIFQKMDVYYNKPYEPDLQIKGYFNRKIENYYQDRKQLFHKSFVFLSFTSDEKLPTVLPVNNRLSSQKMDIFSVLKNPIKDVDELMEEAKSGAVQFASSLSSVSGLGFNRLSTSGLQQVYRQYFNQDFYVNDHKGYVRSISKSDNSISVGEKVVNMVSISGQGTGISDAVYNSWGVTSPFIYPLTQYLYFPHILHTAIIVEDTAKKLKDLDFSKRLNNQMNLFGNQDNVVAEVQIDELTADIRANDKQLVSLKCCISIAELDNEKRKNYIDRVISAIRGLQGAEVRVESIDTLNYFMGFAPGNVSDLYNWITMPLRNAACHVGWITNFFPDKKGDILCDRMRNPLLVNFFEEGGNGMNGITIGPTGSGKSFTMGYLLVQRHERGCKQIIIDVGGSYKNAVEVLQGRYMDYTLEKPLKFNPFKINKDENGRYDLQGSDKLAFLVSLLTVLWKGKEIKYDSDRTAALEKLVTKYYQFVNEYNQMKEIEVPIRPTLKGFHGYLRKYSDYLNGNDASIEEKRDFAAMSQAIELELFIFSLDRFVGDDIYGAVFSAADDEDLSGDDLVCFDMVGIKGNPTLQPIVGLLITQLALDQISKFPSKEKYIYIDEAWSLLNDLHEFIELMYRTSRKVGGSITIITQSIAEIAASPIRAAILQNSTNHIILNHTGPAAAMLPLMQKELGYTNHEIDLIKSLSMDANGKWREIFTKRGDNAKVFVIEAPPHVVFALTSKHTDRNGLVALFKQRGNMEAAINQLVENFQK